MFGVTLSLVWAIVLWVIAGLLFLTAIIVATKSYLLPYIKQHGKQSEYTDKKLEDTIRQWLDIPELSFRREIHEQFLYFKFSATDRYNRPITIYREKADPSNIEIATRILLTSPDENQSNTLDESDWHIMVDKLSLELVKFGTRYEFDHKLGQIKIWLSLPIDDDLTISYFRDNVMAMIRAGNLVSLVRDSVLNELIANPQDSGK